MAKQKRRTKGTGTVFQRSSDKLYVGGVELPKNKKTGERQQKRVYSKTLTDLIDTGRGALTCVLVWQAFMAETLLLPIW
jgi:hypothetical protein